MLKMMCELLQSFLYILSFYGRALALQFWQAVPLRKTLNLYLRGGGLLYLMRPNLVSGRSRSRGTKTYQVLTYEAGVPNPSAPQLREISELSQQLKISHTCLYHSVLK